MTPTTWERILVAQRGVWHAGYENAKEADDIAKEIDKLLLEKKNIDNERLKKLQEEYERLTGEKYDGK